MCEASGPALESCTCSISFLFGNDSEQVIANVRASIWTRLLPGVPIIGMMVDMEKQGAWTPQMRPTTKCLACSFQTELRLGGRLRCREKAQRLALDGGLCAGWV